MAASAALPAQAGVEIGDFEGWMAAEQRRVNLLCLRLVGSREEADQITQEAFFKAYQALERGVRMDEPARWVTRVAVNACLDHLRSQRWQFWKRTRGGEAGAAALGVARDGAPGPEALLQARQIGARIAAGLGRLSGRQRSVFVLRHYEKRSLDEIAEILGLDTGTVKAHLARAVVRLREELKDLYGR